MGKRNKTVRTAFPILILFAAIFLAACPGGASRRGEAEPVEITVNTSARHQYITGFGGMSNAWNSPRIDVEDIDAMFGEGGLGYNIFRIMIYPDQGQWRGIVNAARRAKEHGAIILASPWTPPPDLKSNSRNVGGYLLPQNYGAYAEHLRSFVDFMAGNGVKVDVVSIQNEPDISVGYDSCDWTAAQVLNFIRDYGRQIGDVKVMPGESFQFRHNLTDAVLRDPVAVQNVDIIGGHIYGGGLMPYPLAVQNGKEVWMTEHLRNTEGNFPNDLTWPSAMTIAREIHQCMQADFNAYIWWYLKRFYSMVGDGEYGSVEGNVLRRGYVMSHYAKYATGRQRIEAKVSRPWLMATAYEGNGSLSLVMINTSMRAIDAAIQLPMAGSKASAVESTENSFMKPVSAVLAGNTVNVLVAPLSIVSVLVE